MKYLILEFLHNGPKTNKEIAEKLGVTQQWIYPVLCQLRDQKRIKRVGFNSGARWELTFRKYVKEKK